MLPIMQFYPFFCYLFLLGRTIFLCTPLLNVPCRRIEVGRRFVGITVTSSVSSTDDGQTRNCDVHISVSRSVRLKASVDVSRPRRSLETLISRKAGVACVRLLTFNRSKHLLRYVWVTVLCSSLGTEFHHCSTRLTRESSFPLHNSSVSPFK